MNAHDLQRIRSLKRTLEKAKQQAEIVAVYLNHSEGQRDNLWDVHLVAEHIDIALEKLPVRDRT